MSGEGAEPPFRQNFKFLRWKWCSLMNVLTVLLTAPKKCKRRMCRCWTEWEMGLLPVLGFAKKEINAPTIYT